MYFLTAYGGAEKAKTLWMRSIIFMTHITEHTQCMYTHACTVLCYVAHNYDTCTHTTYTYVHTNTHIYTGIHTHTYTHVHTHTYPRAHSHTHTHIPMCIHTHTYPRAYTHTRTHCNSCSGHSYFNFCLITFIRTTRIFMKLQITHLSHSVVYTIILTVECVSISH